MIAAEFATEMRTVTRHIRREWYRRNSNWVLAFGPSPFSVADGTIPFSVADGTSSSADAIVVPKPRTFKFQAGAVTCQARTAAFACGGGPAINDRQLAGPAAFACGGGPAIKDRQLFSNEPCLKYQDGTAALSGGPAIKHRQRCVLFITTKTEVVFVRGLKQTETIGRQFSFSWNSLNLFVCVPFFFQSGLILFF